MKNDPTTAAPVATVDAQNPWLGLVSFTEDTRGYFHGREEEAAELGRRVQRKLLTVLFGQSGLGKTSILQAGLVPRLRPEGFCPVYVRLDYNPHSPPPSEQIKRAVFRATEAAGKWTKSGTAVAGETLWEFLHHRDDVLQDAAGRTLTPILIFDQFEEIFTLAQTDEAGRRRAQEFLADLADLVENRPPAALEARIDRDEADAAKFDFARADYRILISLREDYLAHLEGLKDRMPSVTQNRMRLARMTGAQALSAVRRPAQHLVSEAVAESIVRFVAGGAALAVAEVEPSLLSLICRELNNARLARGHAEISADLLAGSRDTILAEFYERTLADQPVGVRVFVEDVMLTDSGFRESVAEERVRKGFAAAGAPDAALAQLVDRRLLRVEDRLDQRRVEITHDVLCSVIAASRNLRREREALEESRRQLAAQRDRERATRRALVRARWVAAVASVLMLIAAGSAVFGWMNYRRAQAAEVQAARSRALAEQARSDSEKLVSFLLEDFHEELKPTGRIEIIEKLADKAVHYYEGLPPELRTAQTRLYEGLALCRKAGALSSSGKGAEAAKAADQAQAIFEGLRGDPAIADQVLFGLALSHFSRVMGGISLLMQQHVQAAVDLLAPVVKSGRADRATRLLYAESLNYYASGSRDRDKAVAVCEEARAVLAQMGALDLTDLTAASIYGDVTDTQSRAVSGLGDYAESRRLSTLVGELAQKVLDRRPGDLRAMENRFYASDVLGQAAMGERRFDEALKYHRAATEAARSFTLFNPSSQIAWRGWAASLLDTADVLNQKGQISAAGELLREAAGLARHPANKGTTNLGIFDAQVAVLRHEARLGSTRTARALLPEIQRYGDRFAKEANTDPDVAAVARVAREAFELEILAAEGDYAAVAARGADWVEQIRRITPKAENSRFFQRNQLRWITGAVAEAAVRLGRTEQALALTAEQLTDSMENLDKEAAERIRARLQVRRAQALLQNGEMAEAAKVVSEAIRYYRSDLAKGDAGVFPRIDLARALHVRARVLATDPDSRPLMRASLDEAMQVLGGLSLEARQLIACKELTEWVSNARREYAE